jgi:hypothetical protein
MRHLPMQRRSGRSGAEALLGGSGAWPAATGMMNAAFTGGRGRVGKTRLGPTAVGGNT